MIRARDIQVIMESPIIENREQAERWLRFLQQTQDSQHSNNSLGNAQRWAPKAIECIQEHLNGGLVTYHDLTDVLPEHMHGTWLISYLCTIGFLEKCSTKSKYYRINHDWTDNNNGGGGTL